MAQWIYDNGELSRGGKLVAELLNVMGEPFGRLSKNPTRRQAARERVEALGTWLATIANQAEENGNKPPKK